MHARHPFAPGDDPSLCRACGQTLGKDWHTNAALDAVTVVVEANGEWCATTEGVYQARNLAFAFDGVARDCGPHRIEVWTREAAERAAVEHRRRWRASVGDADCWSLNPYRPDSWCHEPEGHDGDHKGFGEMWPR